MSPLVYRHIASQIFCLAALSACLPVAARSQEAVPTEIILVVGAPGADEYGEQFAAWAQHWQTVAKGASASLTTIGLADAGKPNDGELLKAAIDKANVKTESALWIVMIGHGTYTRQVAKFNLRGPDVSAAELGKWLEQVTRPIVVVNCASSSAPFINQLSGKNRVVVTSTKSGSQHNYSRFGEYFSRAIASPESDLDHDDEVSVHEAFLRASAEVQQFYESEDRISTEHALIDDNGDGRGTPAKMFRGVRPIGKAKDGAKLDGLNAKRVALSPSGKQLPFTDEELQKRDALEQQLEKIRTTKDDLNAADYDQAIEPLLIELAKIYRAAENRLP